MEFARGDLAGDPHAFRFVPQAYLLRGAGGGFESAELDWNDALLADLAALRRPGRDPALLPRLGELLRRFLLPLGWAQHEGMIVESCARGERVVLCIRSAAAELYALPWELLTLKSTGQHLCELPTLLIRYEWPETSTVPEHPSPRPSGSRILFAWSAAGGEVPAAEHLRALFDACSQRAYPFVASRDVLANASYQQISAALAQAQQQGPPVAVLHLLCHGAAVGSTFGLALNADSGSGERDVIDAGQLRQLLAPYAGMVRLVVLHACDGGNSGALGNQLGSVAQALHRAGIATVLASRYPLSIAGSIRLSQTLYERMLVALDSFESAVLFARKELQKEVGQIDWAGVQIYARTSDGAETRPLVFRPYRGLSAFQPADRRFYFGRERDIERIAQRLIDGARMLTVVGASGVGKSSLILAGVVPLLEKRQSGRAFCVRVVRPGATPCLALAQSLVASSGPDGSSRSPVERSTSDLRVALLHRRETLADLLSATPDSRLLLIVDQSEELFSQSDRKEAAAFIDNLLHAISIEGGSVQVILTLRADFLGVCLDEPALAEPVRASMELIPPLSRDDLRQVIVRPAALVGLTLEDGLLDALLDALCDPAPAEAERRADGSSGDDRALAARSGGNLPLLQFTLEQLWEWRSGNTITWQSWRAIGGVRGAIARRSDEVLAGAQSGDEPGLVQRLFGRLVQLGDGTLDTRRRALRSEIDSIAPGRMDRVVDRWVQSRLLTADESEVTIAHEALLYEWETLRRWIEDSRESLRIMQRLNRDARHYFESGESPDDLWHGTPLRRALVLHSDGKLQPSSTESEFLQRSSQAATQHQARLDEQAQRARDLDGGLGSRARTAALLAIIAVSAVGHIIARSALSQPTHETYLLMTVIVGAVGAALQWMLRHSTINNEFNRRTLSLCLSAPLPIFVNRCIGRAFGFPSEKSTVIDLNVVLMLCITGAITLDKRLSVLVAVVVVGILVAVEPPSWIGPIMAIVPTLCILFLFVLFRSQNDPKPAPAPSDDRPFPGGPGGA